MGATTLRRSGGSTVTAPRGVGENTVQGPLCTAPPVPSLVVILTGTRARDERSVMVRAIELARLCRSEPGKSSPKVGAIAVRDGIVLGEAYRGELAPGEHAEYTLLERKLRHATLAGGTLFTTLEPCTTRNPPKLPCADRIVERRLKRVVVGVLDPNNSIRGRGELRLRDAGIEIARFDPDLMAQIEELNRDFRRAQSTRLWDQASDRSLGHREYVPRNDVSADMIRRARMDLGMSQSEFAQILGVSQMAVSKWEKGMARPREVVIERLREFLHSDPDKRQVLQTFDIELHDGP